MTDKAISALPTATALAASDELPFNQDTGGGGFSTKKIAVSAFKSGLFASPTFTGAASLTQSVTGGLISKVENVNAGNGAHSAHQLYNGTTYGGLYLHGAGFTTSGVFRQNGTLVDGSGAGGLTLNTSVNQPIYFAVNATAVGQMTATGLNGMAIGATTPAAGSFTSLAVSGNALVSGQVRAAGGYGSLGGTSSSGAGNMLLFNCNSLASGAGIHIVNSNWGTSQGGWCLLFNALGVWQIGTQGRWNVGTDFYTDGTSLYASRHDGGAATHYWNAVPFA